MWAAVKLRKIRGRLAARRRAWDIILRGGLFGWWHRRWLARHLPLLQELHDRAADLDMKRAGRILDWIGVAGAQAGRPMDHSERVLWLAVELACKQGYSLDEAERLARQAAGAPVWEKP